MAALAILALASASALIITRDGGRSPEPAPGDIGPTIRLPDPLRGGGPSLEEALLRRRSVREYSDEPLRLLELSQLLWAAQGITDPRGLRTAPSAGGTYPLEIYVAVGAVEGLSAGVYKYRPAGHSLAKVREGDARAELAGAALGQRWVKEAAIDIIIAADYGRTTARYGDRGIRYVHMEAGHAAQNILLQAAALGLGAVPVGAFDDDGVGRALGSPPNERPLYIIPIGRPGARSGP